MQEGDYILHALIINVRRINVVNSNMTRIDFLAQAKVSTETVAECHGK